MTEPDGDPELSSKRRPKSRLRRLLLELGVAGLGYTALTQCQTSGLLPEGEPAPDFTALDLNGHPVPFSTFAQGPTLLHFWATWCGICRREFAALNELHEELTLAPTQGQQATSHQAPRLLTLAADEDASAVRTFVEHHQLKYPVVLAPAAILRLYRVQAFPTSYYVDRERRITAGTVGMSSRWMMKTRLSCAAR